jgi:hypothetical protein
MSMHTQEAVRARLNYLVEMAEKPTSYRYTPPPGVPQINWRSEPRLHTVYDGRRLAERFSLDEQGFVLLREPTVVRDFFDDREIESVYYPEVEALAKRATGAEKVVIFDHTVRSKLRAKPGANSIREPVLNVHNDYTVQSGPQRVRDLLEPPEAEMRLRHRFAEINVWRPIGGPVEESPLAICDARSIAPQDLVAADLKYRDRSGEIYYARFNPAHRWIYFPHMSGDEVLLLKCYDSQADGRARFTIHAAFDDPTSPANAHPRESIEVRMMLFFAA